MKQYSWKSRSLFWHVYHRAHSNRWNPSKRQFERGVEEERREGIWRRFKIGLRPPHVNSSFIIWKRWKRLGLMKGRGKAEVEAGKDVSWHHWQLAIPRPHLHGLCLWTSSPNYFSIPSSPSCLSALPQCSVFDHTSTTSPWLCEDNQAARTYQQRYSCNPKV